MPGTHYTVADDQIIINMALKGASNHDIAAVLGRTAKGISNRRAKLRAAGSDFPNAPRFRANRGRIGGQTRTEPSVQVSFAAPEPERLPVGDPVAMIGARIDAIKARETQLLAELDAVREEKRSIFERLAAMIGAEVGHDAE